MGERLPSNDQSITDFLNLKRKNKEGKKKTCRNKDRLKKLKSCI